jgi:hypothetical protein
MIPAKKIRIAKSGSRKERIWKPQGTMVRISDLAAPAKLPSGAQVQNFGRLNLHHHTEEEHGS